MLGEILVVLELKQQLYVLQELVIQTQLKNTVELLGQQVEI